VPIWLVEISMPLPFSVSRDAMEPTIVTSSPSRIHTVPRPITTSQWNRDHGSRSSRPGTRVSIVSIRTSLIAPAFPRHAAAKHGYPRDMVACRVFGHRWRFASDGEVMRWECARDCGASGSKRYPTAEQAARYARAFDREDTADIGRRPLLSLLPLALSRRLSRRDRSP
jgi:hypothetical protein